MEKRVGDADNIERGESVPQSCSSCGVSFGDKICSKCGGPLGTMRDSKKVKVVRFRGAALWEKGVRYD